VAESRFASKLRDMIAYIEETLENNITNRLFKKEKPSETKFPISTEVIGLSLFQMPAIYHHLKEGEELSLYYNYGALKPQQAVEIYFKNFKLGYLPNATAGLIEKVMMHGFDLKVKISQIVKRKYLPINNLFIQIN
jgi:hypothetical protein